MPDGTPALAIVRPAVPRQPTSDECFDAFVTEATERTTATLRELLDDRETLQTIAAELLVAFGNVKALHERLGEARSVSRMAGRCAIVRTAKLAALDEYAVVEAIFGDTLSPAAETLLKAELREAMQ